MPVAWSLRLNGNGWLAVARIAVAVWLWLCCFNLASVLGSPWMDAYGSTPVTGPLSARRARQGGDGVGTDARRL